MRELSVEEILKGIRAHDYKVLMYIYKSFYQQIKYFVNTNNGTDDDAQDVYQEALIVIYRKLVEEDLEIENCSFNTYLYSVCKLLWLKQLEKKRQKQDVYVEEDHDFVDLEDDNILDVFEKSERYKLYQKHFNELQEDCRKVIGLALERLSLRDIAEIMGYKSEKYAKKKKYQCKEKLIEKIKQDPKYSELK